MESVQPAQELCIKWNGNEYLVPFQDTDTVASLKTKLEETTSVQAKRQKLLGLKTKDGKAAGDDALLTALTLKAGAKVMMMGQPEAVIAQHSAAAEAAPEVQDDFDIGAEEEAALEVADRPEVQEKLARRIASVTVKVLAPPRPGKKCLVLDIDYTIFDLNSSAERPSDLARPYLHEFMTACYEHYDIIIWSATSMKWVEVKMQELGVLGHPDYKITCMLDHAAMLTVHTEKYGVFDCKPLAFLWAKFPDQYTPENTVMLDDLRRNFIMNKQQGLVIRPFRKAHQTRNTDKELLYLKHYLVKVGPLPSLSHLDHRKWEHFMRQNS